MKAVPPMTDSTFQQHLTFGIIFLILGVALAFVLDPWFLGFPFLLIGGHRVFAALQMKDQSEE